jgi:hypothetical protein
MMNLYYFTIWYFGTLLFYYLLFLGMIFNNNYLCTYDLYSHVHNVLDVCTIHIH